jgi:hypothetical protein
MLNIITKKLAHHLPSEHELLEHKVVDGNDFHAILEIYQQEKSEKVTIFDATYDPKLKSEEIIPIRDHINKTGKNILIPLRKKLEGEFFDVSNLYKNNKDGIVTTCYGETLHINTPYPSHHLCHFSVLARAMNIEHIQGCLYNTNKYSR